MKDKIVMPKSKFIKEHKNLLKVLKSNDKRLLAKEYADQLAEYKKYVGGRAGVSKASGFIMRMMAENKKKHSGQYKKPTYPLAEGSTMNKPAEFDYKKLASKSQGGLNADDKYGASPFITTHFSGDTKPFPFKEYPKETDAQRIARYRFTAKKLEKLASELSSKSEAPAPAPASAPAPEKEEELPEIVEEEEKKPKVPAKTPEPIRDVIKSKEPEYPTVELDTQTVANMTDREQDIYEFFQKNPLNSTLAVIAKHLKSLEPDYGTALSSISPEVNDIRKKLIDASKQQYETKERLNKLLEDPKASIALKRLQSILKERGTKKKRKEIRYKEFDVDAKKRETHNAILDKVIGEMMPNLDEDFAKLRKAYIDNLGPLYAYFKDNNPISPWRDVKETYHRFMDRNMDKKYHPIWQSIEKRLKFRDFHYREYHNFMEKKRPLLSDDVNDKSPLAFWHYDRYKKLLPDKKDFTKEEKEKAYEFATGKTFLEDDEEEEEEPAYKVIESKVPITTIRERLAQSKKATKPTRDERIAELFKEKPYRSQMEVSNILKKEGYTGTSQASVSLALKRIKEKKGSGTGEIYVNDLMGD